MSDRCSHCGRFVKLDQSVEVTVTPDTHFSAEKTELTCPDCQRDERQKNSALLYVSGSKTAFRCECGCNVFQKLGDSRYECNACKLAYTGEV